MKHLETFRKESDLIQKYGEGNAHLLWVLALYLDEADLEKIGTDGLTDGNGDRKIDCIYLMNSTLYIVQGYYSPKIDCKVEAPANKASDLNTAMAWLTVGDASVIPQKLRVKVEEVRELIKNNFIDEIEILYIHNCAESTNVKRELETCVNYLAKVYSENEIEVSSKELGCTNIERLYQALSQQIVVRDDVMFEGNVLGVVQGEGWVGHIGFTTGAWLQKQFAKYDSDLFSANYRGFMGINKRKRINHAIMQTAKNNPQDFFVFNNGITILTTNINSESKVLGGLSIINGAQTTGSIGTAGLAVGDERLKVMCKIIVCTDSDKVKKIVQYNNTQNHITTWDHYTNSPEQNVIAEEFKKFGYVYSLKRGFDNSGAIFGIESVAQPLVAFHGEYIAANRGRNFVFENKATYENAFHDSKAQHILLSYTVSKAVEFTKKELKQKEVKTATEESQLNFLMNLRSKNFVVAIIGSIIDEISQKPITAKTAKYKYNTSMSKNYSIDDLVQLWVPVVKSIMPTLLKSIDQDIHGAIGSEAKFIEISNSMKTMLTTVRALQPLTALDAISEHIE